MNLHKAKSLRVKLTLYPALIFIAVGLVGTLINLQIAGSLFTSIGEKYTSEILKAKLSEFSQTFDRNIDTSQYMSENPILRNWMKNEDDRGLKEMALENFRKLRILLKDTDTFAAIDSSKSYYVNGNFLNTLSRDIAADSWYWASSRKRELGIDISYNPQLLTTKLWVYVPVWENEKLLGVTGTGLDVSKMINQMVSKVSEGAYVILFNDRGHVKAHIKAEYIDNRTIFYLTGEDGNRIRGIMKRLDEAKNQSVISEFIDYEGKSHMGSFSLINLRSTNWYILVLMDVNALLYSIFVPFILLLVISLMLILGSLLVLINRIVLHPLGIIDSNLAKIMNKDFDVKIDLATGDEFTLVANTINMMTANIKEYTEHLEDMVAQRTKELQQAFEEVNALKVQQDGDYFLTSLLINPLLIKEVKSDALSVDFHISQKKKFTFKKRNGEIGGDVCIAREVVLMDKRYLAFANGDAMGKSLQGAGGALVMGVVFNAYINRTPLFASGKMPEAWLTEIYEELNRVFVSFDGSMLISAVIGLIDEETGAMYYLNAEHPWTVLYRGGSAAFTEEELTLRKIGTVGFENKVLIHMIQLEQGDIIYLGSDGRDDVIIGHDEETGQRIINEDETRFLRCIEEANGDLSGVVAAVEKSAELTDDFTLIRVEWKKSPLVIPPDYEAVRSSALKAFAEKDTSRSIQLLRKTMYLYPDVEVVERLANLLHEAGDTAEEMRVYQYAIRIAPLNEGFLFGMVSAARRIAKDIYDSNKGKEEFKYHIRMTVEYGERLLLLNPNHLKCLIIVADCYRLFKRFPDAEGLLERARRIAADDEMLRIVEKMVERDRLAVEQEKGKKA